MVSRFATEYFFKLFGTLDTDRTDRCQYAPPIICVYFGISQKIGDIFIKFSDQRGYEVGKMEGKKEIDMEKVREYVEDVREHFARHCLDNKAIILDVDTLVNELIELMEDYQITEVDDIVEIVHELEPIAWSYDERTNELNTFTGIGGPVCGISYYRDENGEWWITDVFGNVTQYYGGDPKEDKTVSIQDMIFYYHEGYDDGTLGAWLYQGIMDYIEDLRKIWGEQ